MVCIETKNDAAITLLMEKGVNVNATDKVRIYQTLLNIILISSSRLCADLDWRNAFDEKHHFSNNFAISLMVEKGADLEATVEEVEHHLLLKMTTRSFLPHIIVWLWVTEWGDHIDVKLCY